MNRIFDLNGSLVQAMNKLADWVLLSLLWILGSLPILTVGNATTALYYASMKAIRNEGSAVKNFVRSYRENWKQAIVAELLMVMIAIPLYFGVQAALEWQKIVGNVPLLLVQLLLFFYLAMLSYIFPLLARFDQSLWVLFRNSLLFPILNLPRTVVILVVNALPICLLLLRIDWFFTALPLIAVFVPAMVAGINAKQFIRVFRKYTPQEVLDAEAREDQLMQESRRSGEE